MTNILFAMVTMVMLSAIGGIIVLCYSDEYMENIDKEEEDK